MLKLCTNFLMSLGIVFSIVSAYADTRPYETGVIYKEYWLTAQKNKNAGTLSVKVSYTYDHDCNNPTAALSFKKVQSGPSWTHENTTYVIKKEIDGTRVGCGLNEPSVKKVYSVLIPITESFSEGEFQKNVILIVESDIDIQIN